MLGKPHPGRRPVELALVDEYSETCKAADRHALHDITAQDA